MSTSELKTTAHSFVDRLEAQLAPYRKEHWEITRTWLETRTFGITYPAFLVETYHYVKHSCSLMSRACAMLDPVSQAAAQVFLARHSAEEVGHEQWVLEDLNALGYDSEAIVTSTPLAETMNLIGSQLYIIEHLHPIGILGYVYIMESRPPTKEGLDILGEHYGLRSNAMKFLRTHGDADIEHKRELEHALNNYVTEERERSAVLTSSIIGIANLNRLFRRIQSGDYVDWIPQRLRLSDTNQQHQARQAS